MVTPCHQIQRKRQEKVHDYSQKSFDDFSLIIVNPSPKVTDQENKSVMDSFDSSSRDQCIETNAKIILTNFLMRWNEDKSIARPSTCLFTPYKTVALKIYSIELKYCS